MLRLPLAFALLALPLAAAGQIVHDVTSEGVWVIAGTNAPDTALLECADGFVKLNSFDPISGPTLCTDVEAFEIELLDGDDALFFFGLESLDLDPVAPSRFDGGDGDDIFQTDLSGYPAPLRTELVAPPALPPVFHVGDGGGPLFTVTIEDPTTLFVPVFGPGDDVLEVALDGPGGVLEAIEVFGGGGDDVVDGTGTPTGLPLTFFGGPGDDLLDPGGLDATFIWEPTSGTDHLRGGTGETGLIVIGGEAPLGIHLIRGLLDPERCGLVDFLNGGGVIYDSLERVVFESGPGGVDLFAEVDCDPDISEWRNSAGVDQTFFRGSASGGNRLTIDFEADTAIFTDGFESGDTSAWSTTVDRVTDGGVAARGGRPWDAIDYQDWPSFVDPATSGPSTVVIRGRPDFPVTLNMGPDGAASRGDAVDTLLVDPLGLPFTDDGSQIVIDGGPPIAYTGVEFVRVGAPTDVAEGPAEGAPALAVFPNPTADAAAVRLAGVPSGAVRVTVLDALGREVAVVHDGPVAAGSRAWAVPTARLAPGLYVVRAVGAGWVAARPLAVAR